jgi:redox-sensitive bicupin YhaK (pirin superfamily)
VPVTLADMRLDAGAVVDQELPASYNGFLYVLDGSATAGDGTTLYAGQVGWLDRPGLGDAPNGSSVLRITGGDTGARVVLYAGQPQGTPIVTHGPFVGGTREDLIRASRDYRAGRFERMSALVRAAQRA